MKINVGLITALLALLLVPTFPQTADAQWKKLKQQVVAKYATALK